MAKTTAKGIVIQDPPIATFLFSNTAMAWFWGIVRVWIGWKWLDASLHKVNDAAWVQTGMAVKGFWERAVAIPAPPARPLITFGWYRSFLQFLLDNNLHGFFGKLVAYGEFLVGLALIIGAFVGVAAFFGSIMNWNFMMSGTTSTNPVLLLLAIGLMMAWKIAGYWGADRYLLPMVGTPWQPGRTMREHKVPQPTGT